MRKEGRKGQHKRTFDDLVDDSVGPFFTDIVDNDVRAELAVHEGVRAAKTSACTSDDDSLTIKPNLRGSLWVRRDLLRGLEQAKSIEISEFLGVCGLGEVSDFAKPGRDGGGSESGVGLEDGTGAPLPAQFGNEASANLEHLSGTVGAVGVA